MRPIWCWNGIETEHLALEWNHNYWRWISVPTVCAHVATIPTSSTTSSKSFSWTPPSGRPTSQSPDWCRTSLTWLASNGVVSVKWHIQWMKSTRKQVHKSCWSVLLCWLLEMFFVQALNLVWCESIILLCKHILCSGWQSVSYIGCIIHNEDIRWSGIYRACNYRLTDFHVVHVQLVCLGLGDIV